MMEVFNISIKDDYIQALDVNDTRMLIEESTEYVNDLDRYVRNLLKLDHWEPIILDPLLYTEEIEANPRFRGYLLQAEKINSHAGRAVAIRATAVLHLDKLLEVLNDDAPF